MRGRRQKLGSDGKQNRAADVQMQWEENSGQNDEEDGYGVKSECSKDKRKDSGSKKG